MYFFIIKMLLKIVCCFLLLTGSGFSKVFAGGVSSPEYVEMVVGKFATYAQDTKLNEKQKFESYSKLIDEEYDVKYSVKFVLGSHWKVLSPEQREKFFYAYKNYLVAMYIINTSSLARKPNIVVSKKPIVNGKFEQVDVNISYKDASGQKKETTLGLIVKKNEEGKFLLTDISYQNLSILQSQRDEFNSVISSQGFDALLERLQNPKKPASK